MFVLLISVNSQSNSSNNSVRKPNDRADVKRKTVKLSEIKVRGKNNISYGNGLYINPMLSKNANNKSNLRWWGPKLQCR